MPTIFWSFATEIGNLYRAMSYLSLLRPILALVFLAGTANLGCTPAADDEPNEPRGGSGGNKAGAGGGSSSSSGGAGGSGGSSAPSAGSGGTNGGSPGTAGAGGMGGSAGSPAMGGSGGASSAPDAGGMGGMGGGMPADAAAPDSAPGAFPPGPHRVVLITGDDRNRNDASRLGMLAILGEMKESHGIEVEEVPANSVRAAMMMDKALLIASPNANYFGVTPEGALKNLPVPILLSKDGNTTAYGIGNSGNTSADQDSIRIIATDHPIMAGFETGTIKVMTTASSQRMVQWTNLGGGAKRLATTVGNQNQFTIVAYDKGSDLPSGLKAPAKRVGFFWHRPAGVNDDGKKLFKAAVIWAITP